MEKIIKYLYHSTTIGNLLIASGKNLIEFFRFRIIPETLFLKQTFEKRLGYKLDLEHPKTLNEKIQWLKMNDRSSLKTLCADKYAVREYIKEKIGERYLIPLVYCTDNPADIVPDNMPNFPFIIKTNHISGGEIIAREKSAIDWTSVQSNFAKLLRSNHYYKSKEWQYKEILPRILVEKLLLDDNHNIPNDFKLHCFNGKVVFIQVDIDRHTNHRRNIYDRKWKLIDCQWLYKNGRNIGKPDMLGQMISLAEVIAEEFCYVRVDFYSVGREIYFGELTFHPESGFGMFMPAEWDRKFGDMLQLEQ